MASKHEFFVVMEKRVDHFGATRHIYIKNFSNHCRAQTWIDTHCGKDYYIAKGESYGYETQATDD